MSEQKKVALITGANKGIGLETARQLAAQGVTVLLGARDARRGEAAAKTLKAEGLKVRAVKIDVDDRADHAAIAELIGKDFGKLDILVNNAGVMLDGELGKNSTLTVSEENIRKTFDTNFFAVVALTATLLPLLRKSEAGRIVKPLEHSWVAYLACDEKFVDLRCEGFLRMTHRKSR